MSSSAPCSVAAVFALATAACNSPKATPSPTASAPAPSAVIVPSAGPRAFPPMNPGTKALAGGKRLGELTKDDVAAVLEKAGWNVFDSSTTRSSEHVVVTTVAGRKSDVQTVVVHLYRYEDPEWRASRVKALEAEENRLTFKDGDFVLQVSARTNEQPDAKVNGEILAALTAP